jgi:hypothetical protein
MANFAEFIFPRLFEKSLKGLPIVGLCGYKDQMELLRTFLPTRGTFKQSLHALCWIGSRCMRKIATAGIMVEAPRVETRRVS